MHHLSQLFFGGQVQQWLWQRANESFFRIPYPRRARLGRKSARLVACPRPWEGDGVVPLRGVVVVVDIVGPTVRGKPFGAITSSESSKKSEQFWWVRQSGRCQLCSRLPTSVSSSIDCVGQDNNVRQVARHIFSKTFRRRFCSLSVLYCHREANRRNLPSKN